MYGSLTVLVVLLFLSGSIFGEDPYKYYTWNVTYGDISPLGVLQKGILINGLFPGPTIDCDTNDNLIIKVFNFLDEPFLLTWNGLQQRKNSWQDGVAGTNCPIPPRKNFTYIMKAKDQIGSFFYFPSLDMQKAAGGYGAINIYSRPRIPVPFAQPADNYSLLVGDWFTSSHTDLKARLDKAANIGDIPSPDGLLINGVGSNKYKNFTVEAGKTYRFRICNVGLTTSVNFMIQNHPLLLVEAEGTHTIQNHYNSLDIHLGQSYSVLVQMNQTAGDYLIVVSTIFTTKTLNATAILHYGHPNQPVQGPPNALYSNITFSLNQARSIKQNLTASGPRPNPQGSYHYGAVNITRTIVLQNSAPIISGKQRFAVNGVSFIPADTPLKLADHFKIPGVFTIGSIQDNATAVPAILDTAVVSAAFKSFLHVIFVNKEDTIQSWHLDGQICFVVGMDTGGWTNASRSGYNLVDGISRSTVEVYPKGWTAIYVSLDNVGMWNVRSAHWPRQYLGQQFYLQVVTDTTPPSWRDENPIPTDVLLCGKAANNKTIS